jgi:hypothetical protein
MSFGPQVKKEALVKAARRCCVCRRYKGVGVEVHHIVQEVDGGPNTIDNAIVVCFDCHSAAGHYNTRHPRGTKFSPDELRKHRDEWFRQVEENGTNLPVTDEFTSYYSRHLVCLDNEATNELFELKKERIPFRFDYIADNDVGKFMRNALRDKLPFSWGSSNTQFGHYWGGGNYSSLSDFFDKHPEFNGELERPLTADDFSEDGLVTSTLMRKAVENGFPPSAIGNACVQEHDCGGGPNYYVAMRRPLFVFAELRNHSNSSITLESLMVWTNEKKEFVSRFENWEEGEIEVKPFRNLVLEPGEILLVPECVLLSDIEYDKLDTVFEDWNEISREQGQSVGFHFNESENDYLIIGPTVRLAGFEIGVGHDTYFIPIHTFDPSKCYLFYRAWLCGSCPHLYLQTRAGEWVYGGELFANSVQGEIAEEEVQIPDDTQRIKIVETDFETSVFLNVLFDEVPVSDGAFALESGEFFEFEVNNGGTLRVRGFYDAPIRKPMNYLQARQKLSLRRSYEVQMFGTSRMKHSSSLEV